MALVAGDLLEAEISTKIGAKLGDVVPKARVTHSNRYRPRAWRPGSGEPELLAPKQRQANYFPSFSEPQPRSEQAIVALVLESCGAVIGAAAGGLLHRKTADKLGKQAGATIRSAAQASSVAYSHPEAAKVELTVTPRPKSHWRGEGNHVQGVKRALADAGRRSSSAQCDQAQTSQHDPPTCSSDGR